MSNLPSTVSEGGKSSTELDVTPLIEELHALQVEGVDEIQSHTTGRPKGGKLLAVSQK